MYMTEVKPKKSPFKRMVVSVGFWALGRSLQSLSNFDEQVKNDIADWHDGFSFYLTVLPNGPSFSMIKKKGKLRFLGLKKIDNANLIVDLKNLATGFRMITAQWGVHNVYCQHKTGVVGNVPDSMRLIRLIYLAEDYLFPPILSKNILKSLIKPSFKKFFKRMRIYTLGLLFGI